MTETPETSPAVYRLLPKLTEYQQLTPDGGDLRRRSNAGSGWARRRTGPSGSGPNGPESGSGPGEILLRVVPVLRS